MRLVVVGVQATFDEWADSLPLGERLAVRGVKGWQELLGYRNAVVEFMPDWRTDRTPGECERILWEAQTMTLRRQALLDPFTPSAPAQPIHDALRKSDSP